MRYTKHIQADVTTDVSEAVLVLLLRAWYGNTIEASSVTLPSCVHTLLFQCTRALDTNNGV